MLLNFWSCLSRPSGLQLCFCLKLSKLSAVCDLNLLAWCSALAAEAFNLLDQIQPVGDLAEHNVLSVQPGCGNGGDEELTAVGSGPSVGH